jgi:hypothetical protein
LKCIRVSLAVSRGDFADVVLTSIAAKKLLAKKISLNVGVHCLYPPSIFREPVIWRAQQKLVCGEKRLATANETAKRRYERSFEVTDRWDRARSRFGRQHAPRRS